MAPKVQGAWNLHRASLQLPLDFFLLFSSAASVLGSAGQSGYAAGNQFLDALAHYRRARQLPAVSINWGPWSEVGLAARSDRGGRLESAGIKSLSAREGIEALGRVLISNPSQVTVMGVDWPAWRAAQPVLAEAPFFSRLDGAVVGPPNTQNPARAELLTASPEERLQLLAERLRQHVASVLKLAPSKIELDQPLLALGIDSLMAIELKSRVEKELGIAIPLLQLIKGPSLTELARSIANSMGVKMTAAPDGGTKAPSPEGKDKSLLLSLLSLKASQPGTIHQQ
jgi:acyl carrier protein